MSEFVGRTGSKRVYSYPEANRFRNLSGPFANNFAYSDDTDVAIAQAGTEVPWQFIASTGAGGLDVPITPKSSSRVRITGVFTVACQGEGSVDVQIRAKQDGVGINIPGAETVLVPNTSAIAIPFLIDVAGLNIGQTYNYRIILFAEVDGVLTLVNQSSTLDIQEIGPATG